MAKSKKEKGLFLKRGVYYLRTDPITRRRLSTKCRDFEAAQAFRIARERLANAPPPTPASGATLGEWIGRYWESKLTGTSSKATLGFIESKLGQLRRVLGDDRLLTTITPGLFDSYLTTRRS
ncbi:MAG TPA: hypothetical protein VIV60_18870, partial [Polyangiaceae bacterium]